MGICGFASRGHGVLALRKTDPALIPTPYLAIQWPTAATNQFYFYGKFFVAISIGEEHRLTVLDVTTCKYVVIPERKATNPLHLSILFLYLLRHHCSTATDRSRPSSGRGS